MYGARYIAQNVDTIAKKKSQYLLDLVGTIIASMLYQIYHVYGLVGLKSLYIQKNSRIDLRACMNFVFLSYMYSYVDLVQIFQTMEGVLVVIEFHINSCTCALFVLELRCSAKKNEGSPHSLQIKQYILSTIRYVYYLYIIFAFL